jgi:hypothetical protein
MMKKHVFGNMFINPPKTAFISPEIWATKAEFLGVPTSAEHPGERY